MRRIITIGLLMLSFAIVEAQDYNLGIRAGLNYSKFVGPMETGESTSYDGGFHFGMNFAYNITDLFAINSGLMYIQNGSQQDYKGDSYYIIRLTDGNKRYEPGTTDMKLTVSNAYLSIPLTANFFLGEKFEIYGGVYANFLISPTGGGILRFDSTDDPIDITFEQSLSHHYYQDEAGEVGVSTDVLIIGVDDEDFALPKTIKAYYNFDEKTGNKYNVFDFGVTGGLSYYYNKGLFFGTRVSYGLTDLTNDDMDVSIRTLEDDNQFSYRTDKDHHLGLEFSIGFRF